MIHNIIIILIVLIIVLIVKQRIYNEAFTNLKKKNKFCVIITTFNPGVDYLYKCLSSVDNQTYKNFDLCIVDDASTQNIEELHKIINSYCSKNNWKFYKRTENIGPLGARIDAINQLNPQNEDIIVSVDGDDELNDNNVLSKLNKIYQDDTLITFGNYVNSTNNKLSKPRIKCRKHDFKKIITNNSFRKYKWIFTHLKTFKYKLYKEINHDDLKMNGKYLKSATDVALMYPMLEMCSGKFKCVQNVMYKYNRTHPESHNIDSVKLKKQKKNAKYIRHLKPYENKFI